MGASYGKPAPKSQAIAIPVDGEPIPLQTVPAYVSQIHLQGLARTKDDYVEAAIAPLFKVSDFNTLVFKVAEVQKKLESMGCFRNVSVVIDVAKDQSVGHGYDIVYNVQELGRFVGGVNTMVGANEGSVVFAARLPNTIGRGEKVMFEHTIGSNSNKSSLLHLYKPWGGLFNTDTTLSFFHHKLPNIWSGYNSWSTGGLFDISFESAHKVRHNMQWEGCWRQLEAASRTTSFAVREQSGHSFKSALRHILTVDHRDRPIFPNSGVLLKFVQEYAGVGGDIAFLKHDSEIQANIPLPFDLVLSGGVRMGVMRPLDTKSPSYNILDLFFLGGPQTLRGFEMRSLGSRSDNDVLGGKAYWSSSAHLYGPLPFGVGQSSFGDFFRTHAFINAGNITSASFDTEDFAGSFNTLLKDFRAAYGLGLAVRLGQMARIELNYCWPLRFSRGDKVVRGLQIGVGVDFL